MTDVELQAIEEIAADLQKHAYDERDGMQMGGTSSVTLAYDALLALLDDNDCLRADNAALQTMCDNLAAESGRQLHELAYLRGEVKRMETYRAGIREMATREGPYLD
jgi:hypothetical protein